MELHFAPASEGGKQRLLGQSRSRPPYVARRSDAPTFAKDIDAEYREAGILVNTNGRVPLDEAAPCYKSSESVVEAVVSAGLATVEHKLWPLASLKGTDESRRKGKREGIRKSGRHF
jgi:hypothetical protein